MIPIKRYSQFIILGLGVFAMKIAIISVSTILHATAFGAYLVATVYTLVLLVFVFINVCIIGKYISNVKKEISETVILSAQGIKAWGRNFDNTV